MLKLVLGIYGAWQDIFPLSRGLMESENLHLVVKTRVKSDGEGRVSTPGEGVFHPDIFTED